MMTYKDFIARGFFDTIATIFRNPTNAQILLARVGYPQARIPNFPVGTDSESFWHNVCQEIANGTIPDGLEALLHEAAAIYPGNPVLRQFKEDETRRRLAEQPQPPAVEATARREQTASQPDTSVFVLIESDADPRMLLDTIRSQAHDMGHPPRFGHAGIFQYGRHTAQSRQLDG